MFAPTNAEHAAIVDRLSQRLAELSIGDTVTYEELSKLAERDVRHRFRYLLCTAVEKTEKQLGCLYASVRAFGIKRMAVSESADVGLHYIRRCRKVAKRGVKRIDRINVNSMSDTDSKRAIGYKCMLGAIALVSDGNKARTVAAIVNPVSPIPPASILDMFK